MACSQPCYRVKIILVKEEYTHSLYSMDENPWLDEPSWVFSSSLFFFLLQDTCHVTRGVIVAIYRTSQLGRGVVQVCLSVTQDVHKRHGEHPLSFRLSFNVPDPPLLVLFPCDYDHLSFHKGQLVVIICLAVIDRLHPAGFALPRVYLPWERHWSLCSPCWGPIGVLRSRLGGGPYSHLLIG